MFVCSFIHLFIHQIFIACKALCWRYGFIKHLLSKEKTVHAKAHFLIWLCLYASSNICLQLFLLFPLTGKQSPTLAQTQPYAEGARILKRSNQEPSYWGEVSKWKCTQRHLVGSCVKRPGMATWLAEGGTPERSHCAGWGLHPGSLTHIGLILAAAEIHFQKLQEY